MNPYRAGRNTILFVLTVVMFVLASGAPLGYGG